MDEESVCLARSARVLPDWIAAMEEGSGSQSEKGKEIAEDLLARLTIQEEEEDDLCGKRNSQT